MKFGKCKIIRFDFFNMKSLLITVFVLILSFLFASSLALTFPWNGKQEVVGEVKFVMTQKDEGVADVARRFDLSYDSLINANPHVSPDLSVDEVFVPVAGTMLVVPANFIIPKFRSRRGILINLAEKRLYFFNRDRHFVATFPIGVGKSGWKTPLGRLSIMQKIVKPVWVVPDSIMKYWKDKGEPLKSKIVRAGPDNPLGDFALRLSQPTYLIHGTNEPNGVGRRSSAGCIRMYPEDVKKLFAMVRVKDPVYIVYKPIKMAWVGERLFVEMHPLYVDHSAVVKKGVSYGVPKDKDKIVDSDSDIFNAEVALITKLLGKMTAGDKPFVSLDSVKHAAEQSLGIPQVVSSS